MSYKESSKKLTNTEERSSEYKQKEISDIRERFRKFNEHRLNKLQRERE